MRRDSQAVAPVVNYAPEPRGITEKCRVCKSGKHSLNSSCPIADRVGVVWNIPEYAREWQENFFGLDLEAHNGAGNRSRLPVPATFVVGQDGRVRWRFVEARYWERANPDDVVAAL